MRPNKRTQILDAALRVIDLGGVTEVTFESVAGQAGMTRGGLLYHFPSRDELLQGLHEHLASQWEASLVAAAGTTPEDASSIERSVAYARVATRGAKRTELLLMLETVNDPAMHAPWATVLDRWTPPLPEYGGLSAAELRQLIARLAADGLWLHESLTRIPLDAAVRAQVADYLAKLISSSD